MQRFLKVILTSAALIAGASSMAGAAALSQATLVTPLSSPKEVIIDGKLWKCTGVDCTAPAGSGAQPVKRECARAAKVLGKVSAFSRDGLVLDAAAIAACNAAA